MHETWKSLKDIVECGDFYEVSNYGRVRSIDKMSFNGKSHWKQKGKILSIRKNKNGYMQVHLSLDGKRKAYYLHRLVALTFKPNPKNLPEVNHEDGNKENNHDSNLKWVTDSGNKKHAYSTGLKTPINAKGLKNGNSKLNDEEIQFIRNNYTPYHKEFGATSLAKKFKVSTATIHKIVRNESWKHIN